MSFSPETPGYMFCTHCNEYVSETTFRRHMNLEILRTTNRRGTRMQVDEESSSSDEDMGNPSDYDGIYY